MFKKPNRTKVGDNLAHSKGGSFGRYEETRVPAFRIKYVMDNNINGKIIETPVITLQPYEARYLGIRLLWRGFIDGIWHKFR